jgi:hypothetical protein
MFDHYTLKARYYPMVILFLPLLVLGFFYSIQFESILHFLTSMGIAGALTYLFSQLGRDQGKKKESQLWQGWGGAPSIQMLRFSNDHFDAHTKLRYHQWLQSRCPVSMPPTKTSEESDPEAADHIYQAWTKYLISQTRDKKRYSLLFKENTSYGFRRNLWGLRSIGIVIAILTILGNYIYWSAHLHVSNPMKFPSSFLYSSASILAIASFWILIVKKSWVKLVAFAYAERLCECVDSISASN